jgi:hypothetical protein
VAFRAQCYGRASRQASSIRGEVRLASTTGAAGARRTALPSGGEGLPVVGLGLDRVDEQAADPAVAFRHPAQVPYGSWQATAYAAQTSSTVQPRQMALAARSRDAGDRARSPSVERTARERSGGPSSRQDQNSVRVSGQLGAIAAGTVRSFLGQAMAAAAAGTLVPGRAPGPHPLGELAAALHRPIGCGVADGPQNLPAAALMAPAVAFR